MSEVKDAKEKGLDYGSLGIIFGVLIVVLAIVWVTKMTLSRDDEKSGEGITWVG